MPNTWHNFRTGKKEAGEPKDWRDTIPQDEVTQDLYNELIKDVSPKEAAFIILTTRLLAKDIAEMIVASSIEHQARNN